jgi:hypothetical protein
LQKKHNKIEHLSSSFRDKSNFVFEFNSEVYRAFTEESFMPVKNFLSGELYRQLEDEHKIIKTEFVVPFNFNLPNDYNNVVKHERIRNIIYKDCWTFNMLKDAALLTLDLQEKLLLNGLSLKDASVYNVQFINYQPVFIDLGSIVNSEQETFWSGYKQFCEMFLYPLIITSSLGVNLQEIYPINVRGISADTTWKMLKMKEKRKIRNLIHIKLQINNQKKNHSRKLMDSELQEAGFSLQLRINQIKNLRKIISKLSDPKLKSIWNKYSDRNHYEQYEISEKMKLIEYAFKQKKYIQVIDWGCNDGIYSKKVATAFEYSECIALDNDAQVIDKLYLECKRNQINILPLVVDICNPPGAYGFRNIERESLLKNLAPDLNIVYALVHHLFISENLPWEMIIDLFRSTGDLIIEFPLPEDEKVIDLLKLKKNPELYLKEYKIEIFEKELLKDFTLEKKVELNTRVIYYMKNKNEK